VGLAIAGLQALDRHVGVDLRGRGRGRAQDLLDAAQVGTTLEQVGSRAVAEAVRAGIPGLSAWRRRRCTIRRAVRGSRRPPRTPRNRGAGNNRAVSTAYGVQFPERGRRAGGQRGRNGLAAAARLAGAVNLGVVGGRAGSPSSSGGSPRAWPRTHASLSSSEQSDQRQIPLTFRRHQALKVTRNAGRSGADPRALFPVAHSQAGERALRLLRGSPAGPDHERQIEPDETSLSLVNEVTEVDSSIYAEWPVRSGQAS
jgi:hypothetical protein